MYQRLRNLREDRDLNQTAVAAVVGVLAPLATQSSFSAILRSLSSSRHTVRDGSSRQRPGPGFDHRLRDTRSVEPVMPGDRHMRAEREIIVLPLFLSHVVNDQRHTLLVAPVRDDADVPGVFEDDDVALFPVIAMDIRAERHAVGAEKDVKHACAAEIDIRVGF